MKPAGASRLNSEAFPGPPRQPMAPYNTRPRRMMGTGATDMAQVRPNGVQCYGIGPALDTEDSARGFGAHSDQERILEEAFQQFVRVHWEIVRDLATAKAR